MAVTRPYDPDTQGTLLSALGDLDGWGAISRAVGRRESWCREMADEETRDDPMPVHRLHTHGVEAECPGRCRVFGRSREIREWLLRQAGLSGL